MFIVEQIQIFQNSYTYSRKNTEIETCTNTTIESIYGFHIQKYHIQNQEAISISSTNLIAKEIRC